jgi:hypothetical protein
MVFRGYLGSSRWIRLKLSHREEHEDHKEKHLNLPFSFRGIRGYIGITRAFCITAYFFNSTLLKIRKLYKSAYMSFLPLFKSG